MKGWMTLFVTGASLCVTTFAYAQSSDPADPNPRLAALVPRGMTSQGACEGFNSLALCAATLHAAGNLGVEFSQLKTKIEGGDRLSAAIHTLKPAVDADSEAKRAEEQARSDLEAPRG